MARHAAPPWAVTNTTHLRDVGGVKTLDHEGRHRARDANRTRPDSIGSPHGQSDIAPEKDPIPHRNEKEYTAEHCYRIRQAHISPTATPGRSVVDISDP